MTLVTGTVEDVAGVPDRTPWYFASLALREGPFGDEITTTKSVRAVPGDGGVLSVDLETGPAVVTYKGNAYQVEIPGSGPVDIWDLIEAAVEADSLPEIPIGSAALRGYPVDNVSLVSTGPDTIQFYVQGDAIGSPLPVEVDTLVVFEDPMNHGAVGDGVADDTTAVQAAFDAVVDGGCVFLPKDKTFRVTAEVDLPLGSVLMGGGRWRGAGSDPNLLLDDPDAALKIDSYAQVMNLLVDGGGVANWGIRTGFANSKPTWNSVFVINCVEAGFVFEATQNAVLTNCTTKDCGVGYAFYNGGANIEIIGCSDDNNGNVGGANHRSIVIDNSTDPRLTGTVYTDGNRSLRFWGGIYEYGTGIHQVDILNGFAFETIEFNGVQVASNSATTTLINVGSGYAGTVLLRDTAFAVSSTAQVVTAAAGHIKYRNAQYTGGGGRVLPTCTTLTGSATASYDFDSAMLVESFFQTGLSGGDNGWADTGGTASVSWNSTKKRMSISSPDPDYGIAVVLRGYQYYAQPYRLMRVKFMLRNVSGGDVRLETDLNVSPYHRTIGAYNNGEHDVVVSLEGDETGLRLLSDAYGTPITAEVSYFTAEHLV